MENGSQSFRFFACTKGTVPIVSLEHLIYRLVSLQSAVLHVLMGLLNGFHHAVLQVAARLGVVDAGLSDTVPVPTVTVTVERVRALTNEYI